MNEQIESNSLKSWAEQYLGRLDALSGLGATHYKVSAPAVVPPITVATYMDEGAGHQFGFTIGLSAYDHPSWTLLRPELSISIASADPYWVLAIGHVADRLKTECPFCYGEIIRFGCPISVSQICLLSSYSHLCLFRGTIERLSFLIGRSISLKCIQFMKGKLA